MKHVFLVVMAALVLTGCSKTATVTVDPGLGNGTQPAVDCHVTVPNPDYQPKSESPKP